MNSFKELNKLFPMGYDPYHNSKDYYFSEAAAWHVINFIQKHCRGTQNEWKGKRLVLADWQKAYIGNLFGWRRKDNGCRRYRETLLYIPRKNTKTEMVGAISLYVLACDPDPIPQCYSGAGKRDQARIVWQVVKDMITLDPKLKKRFKLERSLITNRKTGGTFKPLASEGSSEHGGSTHLFALDELHAHKNRDLYETAATGTVAKQQSLLLGMTTAGEEGKSLVNDLLEYALGVIKKKIKDPTFLPMVYMLPATADWMDEKNWEIVNPMLDIIIKRDTLRKLCQQAIDMPRMRGAFKRYHLNIQSSKKETWLRQDYWEQCGQEFTEEFLEGLEGEKCYMAFDLSSTRDTTALSIIFPEHGFAALSYFWLPEDGIEIKEKEDDVDYSDWAENKFLKLTPGNRVDYNFIRQEILDLNDLYDVQLIGYDPHNATMLSIELQDEHGLPMREYAQNYTSMTDPCKYFELLVARGEFTHGNNPILNWMSGNAIVREGPTGNIMLDKKKSTQKIDGIVSTVMALGCWMTEQEEGTFFLEAAPEEKEDS